MLKSRAVKLDHAGYLDLLVAHLELIDEISDDCWIMREGLWRQNGSDRKLCDLIIGYLDSVALVEFKMSKSNSFKGRKQLESSEEFVRKYFQDYSVIRKKMVYPSPFGFYYEIIK